MSGSKKKGKSLRLTKETTAGTVRVKDERIMVFEKIAKKRTKQSVEKTGSNTQMMKERNIIKKESK